MSSDGIAGSAEMPGKYAALPSAEEASGRGAERGQIIVMFAIFLVAMMGMLGLATDVGYTMAAKRSVQGAADSGALAGARIIARYTAASPTSAQSDVTAVVQKNSFGPVTPTVLSCEYIGNNWSVVGTCNQNVPSNAAGARVKTRATFKTWFIQVIPGAPDTVTVGGYAKARVQRAAKIPPDGPFIVCGSHSWAVLSSSGQTIDTDIPILSGGKINPAAVGVTYRIHDSQLQVKPSQSAAANCNATSSRFKGFADESRNAGKKENAWFGYSEGTDASPVQTAVDGVDGCKAGQVDPFGCVMILPIAVNNPAESGNNKQLWVTTFAAFFVTTIDSNTHNARLLDDYIITGPGTDTWCRDCGGPVVIRLIW
jgi:Flp pilus assembly protein TadG